MVLTRRRVSARTVLLDATLCAAALVLLRASAARAQDAVPTLAHPLTDRPP